MKLLCKIGIHKWGKPKYFDSGFSSNVRDYSKKCLRCGKVRKWVKEK